MRKNISVIICYYVIVSIIATLFAVFIAHDYFKSENIFDRNILKSVEIKVSNDNVTFGYATGCFVDSSGTILTNKHVVFDDNSGSSFNYIYVRRADEKDFRLAEVLQVSNEEDLATIKSDYEKVDYYKIATNLKSGQEIFTIGNPNGFGLSFTQGVVSSVERNVIYNGKHILAIQTDFVINEGNSGGCVFNTLGEMVGLVSFRLKDKTGEVLQGISFAVPSSEILDFLK